jgi:hypothetical protein
LRQPVAVLCTFWAAGQPIPAEVAEIQRQLDELKKILDEFDPA